MCELLCRRRESGEWRCPVILGPNFATLEVTHGLRECDVNSVTWGNDGLPIMRMRKAPGRIWRAGEYIDFLDAIRETYRLRWVNIKSGPNYDERILCGQDGTLYTLVVPRGPLGTVQCPLLLSSEDAGETWVVKELDEADTVQMIATGGHPMILSERGGQLNLRVELWGGGMIEVANDAFPPLIQCGPCRPVAVHEKKIWVVYASRKPVEGFCGTPQYVAEITHGSVFKRYGLGINGPKWKPDDHNTPSICRTGDGHLHVLLGSHNGRFVYRRSLRPDDATHWLPPEFVGSEDPAYLRLTYTGLIGDSDGRLYTTARAVVDGKFLLTFWRKEPGREWEHQVLCVPSRKFYGTWQPKLSIAPNGDLICAFSYLPGQMRKDEWERWKDFGDKYATTSPYGKDRLNTENLEAHFLGLLRSTDHGRTWEMIRPEDLEQ